MSSKARNVNHHKRRSRVRPEGNLQDELHHVLFHQSLKLTSNFLSFPSRFDKNDWRHAKVWCLKVNKDRQSLLQVSVGRLKKSSSCSSPLRAFHEQ